jgi:hypothetical protein
MKKHYYKHHDVFLGTTPLPHYKLQLQPVEGRSWGPNPRCTTCSVKFDSNEEFDRHVRKHHVPDSYKAHKVKMFKFFSSSPTKRQNKLALALSKFDVSLSFPQPIEFKCNMGTSLTRRMIRC